MKCFPQVWFLNPLVKNPNIVVGDFSYYDDSEGPEQFDSVSNVLAYSVVVGNPAKVIKQRFPDQL